LWDRIEELNTGGILVHRNLHGVKMNKKSGSSKASADKSVKNIRRKTRQTYSAEEKIRIVLAGISIRGRKGRFGKPRA